MSTNNKIFEEIVKAFDVEGDGLAALSESGLLVAMIDDFKDYELFIKNRNKTINSKKLVKKISNGTNIINGASQVPELKKIFYYSHLAVCCELFNGWELAVNSITRQGISASIHQSLDKFSDASVEKLNELGARVQRTDAVRTIQILRMMGLLSTNSSAQRQLSLAAGNANRELDGVHMSPKIRRVNTIFDKTMGTIVFDNSVLRPESVFLIDNDPAFSELYQSLNRDNSDWVWAINENADQAIIKIIEQINKKNWKPCNLVATIRIDHEIIPDPASFFKQFVPVLDGVSDFIVSVGAGHSIEEFEGRINMMASLFEYLTLKGLEPVLIKLHGTGSPEEQRNSPLFGRGATTTYQILYCKIKKKKLL